VFSTVTSISFAVVMDATAVSRGRYELMSRRWSILGLMSGVSLAVVGQVLGAIEFPTNFQFVFSGLGLLGLVAFRYASQIRVPDHPPVAPADGARRVLHVGEMIARVRTQPAFLAFTARHFLYAIGTAIAGPLLPLFYVRVLAAPDAWIGLIGTAQALMLLVGYAAWRRVSRRRGSRSVLVWATLGAALVPAVLSLTRSVELAAAIVGVGAVFTAGVSLAMFDQMMATVPKGYGVTFTSVDTTLVYLAGVVAPLLAAFLADRLGIAEALVVASAVTLGGALLFATRRAGQVPAEGVTEGTARSPGRG
jgi:Na+/melibiose symporter-like transporter